MRGNSLFIEMEFTMRKKECIIFSVILAAALIAWACMHIGRSSVDYGSIRITIAGEEYGTYSLSTDRKIKIGSTNTVRIKNHTAYMIEADCPDHVCISMAPIDERGGYIACLPNQVLIEGIPSEEAQTNGEVLDSVAG